MAGGCGEQDRFGEQVVALKSGRHLLRDGLVLRGDGDVEVAASECWQAVLWLHLVHVNVEGGRHCAERAERCGQEGARDRGDDADGEVAGYVPGCLREV